MNADRRPTFTLKDLLVVTAIIAVLLGIFIPLIGHQGRELPRRNQCTNKLKQLGLGLMNYYDVFKCFPALTNPAGEERWAGVWQTAPGAVVSPGRPAPNGYDATTGGAAGYSWIVTILPYVEENQLYLAIRNASDRFDYEAFSATGAGGAPMTIRYGNGLLHFAAVPLDEVVCPAYQGDYISTASSGTAKPPVSIPGYAALYNTAIPGRPSGVVISNYVALPATHLACLALGPDDEGDDAAEPPNGVLVPGPRRTTLRDIRDGSSRTLMLCETKETAVNSWYDGTVCWTVGANPSASQQPTRSKAAVGLDGQVNASGEWVFPQGTRDACGVNFGPATRPGALFAPRGTTPAQTQPVCWGPSSDHTAGVVMHLAADASVHSVTPDIDPTLYLRLITRAGAEVARIPDVDN